MSHQERIKKEKEEALKELENLTGASKEVTKENSMPKEEITIPNEVKPFLEKEINFELFQQLLTEKVDMERVTLTQKEFREIKFSNKGIPQLMVKIFCFLTQLDEDDFIILKFDQLYPGLGETIRHQFMRRDTIQNYETMDRLSHQEEIDLKEQKEIFKDFINFKVYEQFFRVLCKNKHAEHQYNLRADFDSLSKGL